MSKRFRVQARPNLHSALQQPGMIQVAMLHDVSQSIRDLLIIGINSVNEMRGLPPLSSSAAEMERWADELPAEDIREAFIITWNMLSRLHNTTCDLLADRTGQPRHDHGE
jgi:hypothetical protein